MANQLGVVVIGIGRAGGVRVRDILQASKTSLYEELSHLNLIGHVSRREVTIEGSKQIALDDVMKDDNVRIVIICSENERHEELARKAIEAGKNVLVEFPLTVSATKAKGLLSLAKQKDVLCYEEDIALLTDQHQYLKQKMLDQPQLVSGKTWLAGSFNGWIEDLEKSGSPFHCNISLIHHVLDLFGDLKAVKAKIIKTDNAIFTEGTIETKDGGLIEIDVQTEVLDKPKRESGFLFKFSDGAEIDSKRLDHPKTNKPGLFMQDLIQFTNILKKKKDGSIGENLTIRGLEIADQLFELAKENQDSRL